jgi:hypothetical protein
LDITLKRKRAFFSSESDLYWNARAVLSKEGDKSWIGMVRTAELYACKNSGTRGEQLQLLSKLLDD